MTIVRASGIRDRIKNRCRLAKPSPQYVTWGMSSWVRYSITVYIGLLISGALAQSPRQGPGAEPAHAPSANHATPGDDVPQPITHPSPKRDDVSV